MQSGEPGFEVGKEEEGEGWVTPRSPVCRAGREEAEEDGEQKRRPLWGIGFCKGDAALFPLGIRRVIFCHRKIKEKSLVSQHNKVFYTPLLTKIGSFVLIALQFSFPENIFP